MENVSNLAQSVKLIQGWFLYRLLKIEQEVRKDVNRKSVKSILDTEARIWGWRQAIRSISSKPGFSNEYRYLNKCICIIAFMSTIVLTYCVYFSQL